MNFENELKQVFDIDIWQLKAQFSQGNSNESKILDISSTVAIKAIEETKIKAVNELAYCNNVISEKIINFFVDKSFNLSFLKKIIQKLFYKSKVSVYYGNSINFESTVEKGGLLINQNEFILQEYSLLSVENKKNILERLHQYADFKTH